MIAAMMLEDRSSGIALAKFGSFAEFVHGPDLAFREVDGLPRVQRRLIRYGD
jgi:hypothetical protein